MRTFIDWQFASWRPAGVALAVALSAVLPRVAAQSGQPGAQTQPALAATSSARDLIAYVPEDVLAVVEVHDAPAAWQAVSSWALPLPKELPPGVRMAPLAIQLGIRSATGHSLDELLRLVAPTQVVAAWRPGERAPVVLSRVEEFEAVDRLLQRKALRSGAVHWARVGNVLVAAPSRGKLESWRRRLRRGVPKQSLLRRSTYRNGRPALPDHGLRAFVDLGAVRRARPARTLWSQLDVPGRLLAGPIAAAIDQASRVDWVLRVEGDALTTEFTIDGSPMQTPAAVLLSGSRTLPAFVDGGLGVVSLDRDVGAFFRAIQALAPDAAVQTQAQLSMFSTLFGGASIEGEVLGALRGPFTLQVLPRDPAVVSDRVRSQLRLPSFVLSADLADPAAARKWIHRGLGNFTIVAANQRRQQGKPRFRVRRRRVAGSSLRYIEFDDWDSQGAAPLEFDLSPAWWVGQHRALLGSTVDGVMRAQAAGETTGTATRGGSFRGDLVRGFGQPIAEWLRENERFLALSAVLKDGISWHEATQRMQIAAAILERLERIEWHFEPGAESSRAALVLERRRS